jgi:hypothetical protein
MLFTSGRRATISSVTFSVYELRTRRQFHRQQRAQFCAGKPCGSS